MSNIAPPTPMTAHKERNENVALETLNKARPIPINIAPATITILAPSRLNAVPMIGAVSPMVA
ncbi:MULTISPECIES: hypothetical protein [Agrobacterium]|uniref:Uncharacterized protein n=1 Tax=Agrobacterium tumefaciens TaxID=358 RepID=A0AAF0H416_AGRTU|nr:MULTISPECIES: hypothetical protein [Agrobacterium]WGM61746.1 hypothetical protein CFBP5506_19195 [Agrobacterium tumefaciens]CVI64229.1 hypothetical protein AGR9A_Lc50097 [Agrobacterium salinitolerans str. Hayward 0363]